MKVGLFPGQGIDKAGVLAALPEDHVRLREARRLLGYDLRRAVERSGRTIPTRIAQPAILTAGVIAFEGAVAEGDRFEWLAGHSLGEYTALVAAQAISFPQGLRLVAARGEAMKRAANRSEGGMVAVLRLDLDTVEAIARTNDVVVANDNTADQVVLSGDERGLAGAARDVSANGGRVVRLPVEGAFHGPAMDPAVDALDDALTHVMVRQPRIPVVSNVTERPYRAPGEVRKMLLRQLTGRVRFRGSMEWLRDQGVDEYRDLGPGRVVEGLARSVFGTREVARV